MKKTHVLTSLDEDLIALGLVTPIVEAVVPAVVPKVIPAVVPAVVPAVEPASNLDEIKILKLKTGSAARLAKKKAKRYYKQNKSKLKSKAKKFRHSSAGKKSLFKRTKAIKRLGIAKSPQFTNPVKESLLQLPSRMKH
jgi:hypothetical protein